jgi:hypothetical protein
MAKQKKSHVIELVNREKESAVEILTQEYDAALQLSLTQQAAERIGALKAIHSVQKSIDAYLTSQKLRAIQLFCANKDNLTAYGCTSVDEFLDKRGEDIGVTRNEYWSRMKLLENEGDNTFDALQALGIPLRSRKLLQGEVSLSDDGEEFIIGGQRIAARNKTDLLAAITALHQERVKDKATIEAGKEDVQRLRRQLDGFRRTDAPPSNPPAKRRTQLELEAAALCGALTDFNAAYAEASAEDRNAFFISHGGTAEFLLRKALSCVPASLTGEPSADWLSGQIDPESLQDD